MLSSLATPAGLLVCAHLCLALGLLSVHAPLGVRSQPGPHPLRLPLAPAPRWSAGCWQQQQQEGTRRVAGFVCSPGPVSFLLCVTPFIWRSVCFVCTPIPVRSQAGPLPLSPRRSAAAVTSAADDDGQRPGSGRGHAARALGWFSFPCELRWQFPSAHGRIRELNAHGSRVSSRAAKPGRVSRYTAWQVSIWFWYKTPKTE